MTLRTATATAVISCLLALPALAAHGGTDVKVQGNHKKTLVAGEKGAYHLVDKGAPLTATVKGPAEVTVLLHGTTTSSAAGLFLDKKKIHFVDLKGAGGARLSSGGTAGPLKSETVSVPAGNHELRVEAFTGGAAVSFHVAHAAGSQEVAAGGKRGKHHKGTAQLAAAPLAAEPIAPPPSDLPSTEATPLTAAPAPLVAATPTPPPSGEPPPPAAAPAGPPTGEDSSMMMGEPPAKPSSDTAAPPAPVPAPIVTTPAPAAATSNTSVSVEPESRHSSATYWLAGTFVLLAAGAGTLGALSSSENSSYLNAKETAPNRASMLSTANTELTVAEALAGGAIVALAVSAIVAW